MQNGKDKEEEKKFNKEKRKFEKRVQKKVGVTYHFSRHRYHVWWLAR